MLRSAKFTVFCLAFWSSSAAAAMAQISPGTLSKAHAFLTGSAHCIECHDVAKRPPEFKCLDCHKDIQLRLSDKRGLHASLVGQNTASETCAKCHSEHNGSDFALIHWDTPVRSFDHRSAGYTLEGKHARLACKDCHQPSHIPQSAVQTISMKDLGGTYLGLSRKCIDCHADAHHGQLGPACERCHDASGWKESAHFDHSRAQFRLEGAHQKVECAKCHARTEGSAGNVKYKGIAFTDCTPCHSDPHRGAFHASCRTCHNISDWKPMQVASAFNHFQTGYPLLGKHAAVACKSCHHSSNFKERVAFAKCTDCHKTDPHHGQFQHRAGGGDCAECHKVEGFKPALFSVEQHQATGFPLLGPHQSVPCAKCHAPGGTETQYRINTACSSCHADVHKDQFSGPPYQNRCESCHTVNTFRPSTYTIARHSQSRFVLTGAHAAVFCANCHSVPDASHPVQYRYGDRSCTACHRDPHQGEFAERMKASEHDGQPSGCETCHSTRSWQDLHGFDHDVVFKLEGAHRGVGCASCHKPGPLDARSQSVTFSEEPRNCSGCHEDIHGGQFVENWSSLECARCHGVTRWKPSSFDHQADSTYPLTGAHLKVPCTQCHKVAEKAGRMVIAYKGTPRECSACHGNGKAPIS